ncbi:uncharacterized protein SPAPADRAFT_60853 [Spathaspora passalidarum NRRL Y-27907]|uniref:Uncharacterized protein n=1 Tax=Spathaspora passalidarum (strain NRRL Y-27907 / 11-Y1) TaxID=619300 RepID=G3AMQ9_SPAPN|nr:uncharacterized protein SPAPADRAFT_60853 [Spathaspora passalidarum NRRL Y-27907]EGW33503.1 hypothetical protein SPAPADRAFT_60853 [Spathaspora passalidarum NRRL Y-27907]
MAYSLDANKWKAYQFSDPFAVGPDCDAYPITNLRQEIKFTDTASDALKLGYIACDFCDPCHSSIVDVDLLIKCVSTINHQIGFMPPLLDEDEEYNTQKIKENILETKRANEEQILKTFNNVISNEGSYQHRYSVPIFNTSGKLSKDLESTPLSKNDSDHYRLVDLACRHLALAAAVSVFQPHSRIVTSPEVEDRNPSTGGSKKKRRRRRRGGVLGFKELAAKSKLSAWHFHRVFKSVTGLTPKTYGDKCFDFLKKVEKSGEYTTFQEAPVYNSPPMSSNSQSRPVSSIKDGESSLGASPLQQNSPYRMVKLENTPMLFKTDFFSPTQQLSQQTYTNPSVMITPPNESIQYTTLSPTQALDSQGSATSIPNLNISAELQRQLNPMTQTSSSTTAYGDLPATSADDIFPSRAFSLPELSRSGTSALLSNTFPADLNVGVAAAQQSLLDPQVTHQQGFDPIAPEYDLSREIYPELSRSLGPSHANVTFEIGPSDLASNAMVGTLSAPENLGYSTTEDIFSNDQKYNPQMLSTNIGL